MRHGQRITATVWLHFPCGVPCDNSGVCVDGVGLLLNPGAPCGLGVEAVEWGAVKSLYRDPAR